METVTTDLRARWRAFKTRIQAIWFWRVFGVCAMRKLWTKFLVAVAIAGCYLAAMFGLDLLTPVLALEKMNRTEGVPVAVYGGSSARHSSGASKIVIRTDTGEEKTFRGFSLDKDSVVRLKKTSRLIVWSQVAYEAWPPFIHERFWRIQEGKEVLVSYGDLDARKQRHIDPFWFQFSCALAILPLLIVVSTCRREASAE